MPFCECGINIESPYYLNQHLESRKHHRLLFKIKEKKRLQENGLYKAKIYKVVNNVDDKIYIGSTNQPLCNRMYEHRIKYKQGIKLYTSYDLFDTYGIDNCKIVLIEEIEVRNREEQYKKEREWYDRLIDVIVNNHRPFVTKEEKVERTRLYDENNLHRLRDIKKKRKEELGKYKCECGSFMYVVQQTRHCKSKKHQNFINSSKIDNDDIIPVI